MKKQFFLWLSLVNFSFLFQTCHANKIDLLKVVNENIEQYKTNAMNQQQNTRGRTIDGKTNQSMANKNIMHKILFHIKNNRNLLLAVATAATSIWGVRLLLKRMPSSNSDTSSLDNNNEGLFGFEDNLGLFNQQPEEATDVDQSSAKKESENSVLEDHNQDIANAELNLTHNDSDAKNKSREQASIPANSPELEDPSLKDNSNTNIDSKRFNSDMAGILGVTGVGLLVAGLLQSLGF